MFKKKSNSPIPTFKLHKIYRRFHTIELTPSVRDEISILQQDEMIRSISRIRVVGGAVIYFTPILFGMKIHYAISR